MRAAASWVLEPKVISRQPFYLQSRKVQTLQKKFYPTRPAIRNNISQSEVETGELDDIVRQRHGEHESKPSLGNSQWHYVLVKRNELGVQLLSRGLHRQIFKSASFPAPPTSYVQISKEHLSLHGLDPSQGSKLPDVSFQLPPLQGANISEHFHSIGAREAEPWLSLAKMYASGHIPPKPECWHIHSGWTKYYYSSDGSSYYEHVESPCHDGKLEDMLTFDVETMPKYHPYPVMACAASPSAWYAWISPWLLGESNDPHHFIPLGNPSVPKIIVGHNVSYDRIRVSDEYNVHDNANRFIDTMSLHIAVSGISSHQRPAWAKYQKAKILEEEQREEAVEAIVGYMKSVQERVQIEADVTKRQELRKVHQDMEDSLLQLQTQTDLNGSNLEGEEAGSEAAKRWEDITAANSLRDVAKLHCNIKVDKDIRNDLISREPDHIRDNLVDFLDYCAIDVQTTFQVYSVTLPAFLSACPHPVSFAGMLIMGSPFLTVDENWEEYLRKADGVYHEMEEKVEAKLKRLAEEARNLMDDEEEKWKSDPWLSQLDWTPKVAGKSRGVLPPQQQQVWLLL
jgi:DNA polymerase gamma 1